MCVARRAARSGVDEDWIRTLVARQLAHIGEIWEDESVLAPKAWGVSYAPRVARRGYTRRSVQWHTMHFLTETIPAATSSYALFFHGTSNRLAPQIGRMPVLGGETW